MKIKIMKNKIKKICKHVISPRLSKKIKSVISRGCTTYNKKEFISLHGVCDNTGGDFKNYFFENDMPRIVSDLKNGLDTDSSELVDLLIKRIMNFPNQAIAKSFLLAENTLMTKNETAEQLQWEKIMPECMKKYSLTGAYFLPEVFMYHHGLLALPEAVKDYISGKDFIDAGAFVGDSAFILHKYSPRKVYSFEISSENSNHYRSNMEANGISPEKYELVDQGIGDQLGEIAFNDIQSSGSQLDGQGATTIKLTTVDDFACTANLNVGFVKADIEGFESPMVKGMVNTLKKYRPVLSIAIYHNPKDFFEIKPFIEALKLNYKFEIKKFNPRVLVPMWETSLIAYPAELDQSLYS